MAKRLKLFGIAYLVGKISRSNDFISGFHSLSEIDGVFFLTREPTFTCYLLCNLDTSEFSGVF